MYKQYFLFVFCTSILCLTESAPPSFITKCKPNDSKCIKENAKVAIPFITAGLSEYNMQPLDPLVIKVINATEGNLLFVLTDVTAVGLKNCEIKKIEHDIAKSKMFVKILCSGKLDGQYELRGNLLFVPIQGQGAIHVDLNSAAVNIELDVIDKDGADGKKHWNIKSWKHSFELKGKSKVYFENLYNGNEVLGRAARDLIENNGNDIIMEIGPNVIKAVVAKVVKAINNFFKAVPTEDLTIV